MKKQSLIPVVCMAVLSFCAVAVASVEAGYGSAQETWMKCCQHNQPPGGLKCSECKDLACCYKACLRGCSSDPGSILYKKCAGFCDRNF